MQNGVEALTGTSLTLALDAATMRHQVHAANIANAGVAGYKAQRLNFEAQVHQGLQSARTFGQVQAGPQVSVRIEPDLGVDGQPHAVQLDVEVAAMSQNSVHYQTLVRALNRQLSILASAVSEGKR
ncbi:MAG: flagellar basal body protein [Rhizobacter sp.]|nr:flagellar basal body protein [Rhizobacter sp.]